MSQGEQRYDSQEGGRGQIIKDIVGQAMAFLLYSEDYGKTLEDFKQQREVI